MENRPIGDMMDNTMSKIKEMVDANTIVGEPITTLDGVTLVPISRVSFAFATGGGEYPVKDQPTNGLAGGNTAGVKIVPVAFIVIKDGNVRMLNIAPPAITSVDRVVELIPDIMDKIQNFLDSREAEI